MPQLRQKTHLTVFLGRAGGRNLAPTEHSYAAPPSGCSGVPWPPHRRGRTGFTAWGGSPPAASFTRLGTPFKLNKCKFRFRVAALRNTMPMNGASQSRRVANRLPTAKRKTANVNKLYLLSGIVLVWKRLHLVYENYLV